MSRAIVWGTISGGPDGPEVIHTYEILDVGSGCDRGARTVSGNRRGRVGGRNLLGLAFAPRRDAPHVVAFPPLAVYVQTDPCVDGR